MIFDTSYQIAANKAQDYLTELTSRGNLIELKRLSPQRSLKQNAYLHLIITAFGVHFGYTAEEAKLVYKYLNKEVYRYKKHGITFWRSSADLTKDEMTQSIEQFRAASAKQGYELPTADNHQWLRQLHNEVEQARHFTEAR